MFLDERELFRGIRLAVVRVVPRFRRFAHTEHHALDAPAGVAEGECGGLTYLFFSSSFFGFHSRANRCASAICAGVILEATRSLSDLAAAP